VGRNCVSASDFSGTGKLTRNFAFRPLIRGFLPIFRKIVSRTGN